MRTVMTLVLMMMSLNALATGNLLKELLSPFDVEPLNSPVKERNAKFLLKTPKNFEIDQIKVFIRNEKNHKLCYKEYKDVQILTTPKGNELHIRVSEFPPGPYNLFVRVKDKKKNVWDFKTRLYDFERFTIDASLEVADPGEDGYKTLLGIDADKDNVRDDIQRWINEAYPKSIFPSINGSLKQISRYKKMAYERVNDKVAAAKSQVKSLEALSCLLWIAGRRGGDIETDLAAKSLNTPERIKADITLQSYLRGTTYPASIRDMPLEEHFKFCEFSAKKE